jgi:hypothetical protein
MSIELSQEQRIMILMRKTLAKVIKDTTPAVAGLSRVLGDDTIEDIRSCLALIAAREQEMAKEQGREITDRPRFTDEPKIAKIISLTNLKKPDTEK